ncbi:uncharacterized protein CANTADRAFT_25404 [Suhomyces tanzawaensis NRRL Y-17324]|uniref:Uncharacterized protein n=1 Tax=Suhomyces tanzawaensis NRRL Y-17324 TaxID=984487 RepID=A0A1E4SNT0_9ASCO|nr:uncharacterized protein CANTADRAFT_25404 [Suhomyces tanzawaensis NRRL Y-17324]ODV81181.1 hypothetical protein CANTADRAFT_25404 [Suhomyces tanzawaensis NRRL Y-17324]
MADSIASLLLDCNLQLELEEKQTSFNLIYKVQESSSLHLFLRLSGTKVTLLKSLKPDLTKNHRVLH